MSAAWIIVIILFMFLIVLCSHNSTRMMPSTQSEEFAMIPSDQASTIYVPQNSDGQVVFRPIVFSDETTAPQRIERRTSTPVTMRSSPPSAYVKSF